MKLTNQKTAAIVGGLSYALDASGLMAKAVPLEGEDVKIVSLDVADGGALGTTRQLHL